MTHQSRVIVTGGNGTVGRVACEALRERGFVPIGWDRRFAPPDDEEAGNAFIERERPGAIMALAVASQQTGIENEGPIVNVEWPTRLARIARERGIPFLFTSTVMVYTNNATRPFTTDNEPDETEGYGAEKLRAERAIREANPGAIIARIGWQIGLERGGNHMVEHIESRHEEGETIDASTEWLPACSFLPDTAEALVGLVERNASGLHHVDGNEGWNFFQIVTALNDSRGGRWNVNATDDFVYDQRLINEPRLAASIATRLPSLATLPIS
ncbi:MAG: sugar nucleotide-binding protein [Planctomycetota bacterium]